MSTDLSRTAKQFLKVSAHGVGFEAWVELLKIILKLVVHATGPNPKGTKGLTVKIKSRSPLNHPAPLPRGHHWYQCLDILCSQELPVFPSTHTHFFILQKFKPTEKSQ